MQHIALFDAGTHNRIVNVASVPQRSPFRYPGGKTWLISHIRKWLSASAAKPQWFIEPFAGGGIVSLTVAAEHLAERVLMVELDTDVAAVWQTILDVNNNEWLAEAIRSFELSHDSVRALLAREPESIRVRAFQTIVKNRVYHGGVMAPGSGLLKYGENGRGILSRWYPETLARRIRSIAAYAHRITFVSGDALQVIPQYACDENAVFFLDPPYTICGNGKRAGRRLYRHSELDHEQLFREAGVVKGDFLMTYDDAPEVRDLALAHHFEVRLVAMKNTHHAKMQELLIGRDLTWA